MGGAFELDGDWSDMDGGYLRPSGRVVVAADAGSFVDTFSGLLLHRLHFVEGEIVRADGAPLEEFCFTPQGGGPRDPVSRIALYERRAGQFIRFAVVGVRPA